MGSFRRSACLALAAAAIAGLGVKAQAQAQATQPSYEDLKQQVDQLKARLDQVEAKQTETVSAKEVDATVERVIADAQQRSQLLQMEGFTAGYTKGRFTIQDAAGNWVLRPTFQFQIRWSANYRDDGKHAGNSSDTNDGFEIPRMKIGFDGNAFNPNLTYYFLWNTSSTTGSLGLEQAWVRYQMNDQWALRAGQIINPAIREQAIGSRTQLAVDRSLMNTLITGAGEARTQALTAQYGGPNDNLWAEAGIEDGFNSQNTDFTDPNFTPTNNDWGVTGRVNYLVKGPRSEVYQFSAQSDKDDLLMIGGGGDITQTGDTTNYLHTADVQWDTNSGFGLYGAYVGNYIDNTGASNTLYNWGFLVQGSYLFNPNWEVFGRWDYTKLDSGAVSAGQATEYCEITVGVNWYIFGSQSAKFTADATWLPNGSPANVSSADILASQDNEFLFRGQFQLLL